MTEVVSPDDGRPIAWLDADGCIETADDLTLAEAEAIHAHFETDGLRFIGSPAGLMAMSRVKAFTADDYHGPQKGT